jgi:3-hydroxyisobutyrate dehydrogenase
MRVGFIGLGKMGSGMALNLCKAGVDLRVYDVHEASAKPLLEAGAIWASTVADVVRDSDVVFTSLPGPQEVKTVANSQGGLFESMRDGAVWFDLSTNSVSVLRELGTQFKMRNVELLDAPVSGGPAGARSGKLAIYVGGNRSTFDSFKHLLDFIGDEVLYVGELSAGTAAKLVHNTASNIIRMAIAEVFSLGVRAGVEPLTLWHAIRQGGIGRSRTFDRIGDQYLQSKYEIPSFALRLAHKDMTLALDLARELNVPMRHAELTYDDYTTAMDRGWGDLDSRSPMQLQNERAGVSIKETAEDVKRTFERC